MGWAFVIFAVGCGALALGVAVTGSRTAVTGMVAWCGAALVTYAATRVIAFPMLADDVGNWAETWGLVSISFEALTVAVGGYALSRTRSPIRSAAR